MGWSAAPRLHRVARIAIHHGNDQARRRLQPSGRLCQRRDKLPHLVGLALLRGRDGSAGTASLSRRVELSAKHWCEPAITPTPTPADLARHLASGVGGVH